MKGLKTMAKKKETEPKGADKKNEKINGEKTDNVEIEVEKEVSEAESLASQLKTLTTDFYVHLPSMIISVSALKKKKRRRTAIQRHLFWRSFYP